MKNILKLSIFSLLFLATVSCSDDDNAIATAKNAPELIAPEDGTNIVLNPDYLTNPALTLVWNHAGYDVPTQVNYQVEVAKANTDFADPIPAGPMTHNRFLVLTVEELNNAASDAGLSPTVAEDLEIRVVATLGDNSEMEMISNVATISVTTYQLAQDLYLVGSATEAGWSNNNNNTPLFRSPDNQFDYTFVGYFNAGDFKVLSTLGEWHPQYGVGATAGTLGMSTPTGGSEPGVFNIATAGYYTFKMNTQTMTYTLEQYDASGATTYGSIGITGNATPEGWPNNGIQDVNMTVSSINPHLWKVDNIVLSANEAKFRADDAWTNNWGGTTPVTGVGEYNGGTNIPVEEAGTYDVWFNDLDGRYIFIKQ